MLNFWALNRTKVQDMYKCFLEALWFLTGLLVSGQRLVNRCQRPEKELPSLPAAGILAGVPAAELLGPGGMTHRSGMRRAGGVAY